MSPIAAAVLSTLLHALPANDDSTVPFLQMTMTVGIAGHRDDTSWLPMLTFSAAACFVDKVVVETSAGWLPFEWDVGARGGLNWRLSGTKHTGTVIDFRALAGVHVLTERSFMGVLPNSSYGVTAGGELASTVWSSPASLVAFNARAWAGVETTGSLVYPTAHLSLGVAF